DEPLRERKAQAGARRLVAPFVESLKHPEHPVACFLRNTDPGVPDLERELALVGAREQRDVPAPSREFHRVRNEVEEDLPYSGRVDEDRRRRMGLHAEEHAFGLGGSASGSGDRLHEHIDPEDLGMQLELPGLDFGKIENVVDELEKMLPS